MNSRQTSKLFVKLFKQQDDSKQNNSGVICDPQNCRVCVRSERSSSTSTPSLLTDHKPKWWKSIVKNTTEDWKDLPVESIFTPETSNRCVASECFPMLINAALEGASTCLAVSSSDCEVADHTLYGTSGSAPDRPLLATSISWLFDLIDTFRVTRSSIRFSVRVSAVRLSINNSEITTTDLLEHIAQDGSSGDIPKMLGIGRISGPRELRASSAKQALAYVDTAIKAALSSPQQPGIFVFSLNVYQYQIERQPNGSETISGGRGQFHFVDLSKSTYGDAGGFSGLQEKVVGSLSKNLPCSNLPTAFASLTGQILREFQRCRLCHFLAVISAHDQNSRKVLELFDTTPSAQQSVPTTKRRQSPSEQRQTSASYDSATLPRLSSFTSFTEGQQLSTSINGRLSHCVSGSELSIHTVIHRPSPPPSRSHQITMQTSFSSQTSNGAPPSLATSNFSSSLTRPSCYSDSETESICRIRQPCLAPMQPLDFQKEGNFTDDEESGFQTQNRLGNSVSANCSPAKQKLEQNSKLAEKDHHNSKSSKYARLKRFASSRMKRQIEQQKMWAMMNGGKTPNPPPSSSLSVDRSEIWIDGPGAMMNVQNRLQQVEDWIDGPMTTGRNNVASNPQFHQQLCHQLNLESCQISTSRNSNNNNNYHRSLPRMRHRQQVPGAGQQNLALVTMRNRVPQKGAQKNGHRPPSISCSSENLFVDSGYFAESTSHSGVNKFQAGAGKLGLQPLPTMLSNQLQRPHVVENFDFLTNQRRLKSSQQSIGVTWGSVHRQDVQYFIPPQPIQQIEQQNRVNFVEAKKIQQSPFMRLKNKILGKKSQQQIVPVSGHQQVMRPGTTSVPSSPAVISKRHQGGGGHHLLPSGLIVSSSNQPGSQGSGQNNVVVASNNRISRLTDTSDSGNDSGVALFVGPPGLKVVTGTNGTNGIEDALSTTKSLSSSSSGASPPSPASAAGGASSTIINPAGQKTTTIALSSGSVCSHSSGRGSSSSLLSHSVGGSQPSIAETSEMLVKMHVQNNNNQNAWSGNAAALSSVEEELASAVSALHQTLAPKEQQQQQPQQKRTAKPPATLHTERATPRQQRHHLKLDISEVSESPSRDELLCLESLEQQLLS